MGGDGLAFTVVRWRGQGEVSMNSRCLYDLNFLLTPRWEVSGVEEELGVGAGSY